MSAGAVTSYQVKY